MIIKRPILRRNFAKCSNVSKATQFFKTFKFQSEFQSKFQSLKFREPASARIGQNRRLRRMKKDNWYLRNNSLFIAFNFSMKVKISFRFLGAFLRLADGARRMSTLLLSLSGSWCLSYQLLSAHLVAPSKCLIRMVLIKF